MVKNILVLDDGTEIAAGTVGQNAILSLTCTETVSKTTDLCPGAACSNKLEITIWVEPGTDLPITSGTRLTHYRETSGQRTLAGTYWAVKPTSQTRNTYKVYAYDAVSRLDSVQSTWLRSIQDQFPMTLWKFAGLVAQRCGVTIANNSLPRNGTYLVQAFYADNLTGRQLLAWVAEASCTFLRATSDGKIEFAWYTNYSTSQSIGPTVYIRDGLSHDKFQTAPVAKVQIRQSDDDVGVLYPSDESGSNALVIQGNLLLTSATAEALKPVAQAIFETMQGVTYTPLKVTVPADFPLPAPGNIVSVTDARGNVLSSYIMTRKISGQQVTLESTGNATRDGTAAVNEQSYKNLTGKMLEIKTSVDGLEVKASDLTGKYTDLKATVDGLSSEVKKDTKITGGGNLILGSESFKNAKLQGNAVSGSSVTYNDTGSATVTNANSNRYFHWQTVNEHASAGVTLCLSVMYKPVSGTDELCMEINYNNTWAVIKAADQIEIKQTNGWVLRYGLWTPSSDAIVKWVDIGSGFTHAGMGNYTNKFELLHPMLQYGNAPTAWTASSGDYLTANETKTEIKQTFDTIKLTASTSGTSSTIKLTAGGTEITSAQISMTGVVTFSDLSTWNQDKTIINGGNITTGQIHNLNYTTVYDLDNAWIRMGTEAGERVYIDNRHIAWYATINTGSIGLTGVLYSEAGSSYIGACSKYARYGWVNGLDPTSYVGMQITHNRSDDSDADFNTTRVGVSGTLNCKNLSAWGSKSRIVSTSFGTLKMAAFETPTPTFADWGRGECGPDGWCLIVPDPRYAETVAKHGQPTWLLTDCDGTGHLWAEDCGQYAIVHGAPGQKFAWMAMAAQRGYEGEYAEPSECNYPAGTPAGIDMAASTAARALDAGADAAEDLLTMDTGANLAVDTLLEDLEGNEV